MFDRLIRDYMEAVFRRYELDDLQAYCQGARPLYG
jgi:hypothetical protein